MQTPEPSRPTVLIAERDQTVRQLEKYFLDKAGLCVSFAADGQEALEHAQRIQPAVVVTEILLPRLDGLTLCRQIHSDPATRSIPVIVFSVLAASARAIEAGAHAFLRKPFVETTFLASVQSAMASQRTDPAGDSR